MNEDTTSIFSFSSNGNTFDTGTFVACYLKDDGMCSLVGRVNDEVTLITLSQDRIHLYMGVEDADLGV